MQCQSAYRNRLAAQALQIGRATHRLTTKPMANPNPSPEQAVRGPDRSTQGRGSGRTAQEARKEWAAIVSQERTILPGFVLNGRTRPGTLQPRQKKYLAVMVIVPGKTPFPVP